MKSGSFNDLEQEMSTVSEQYGWSNGNIPPNFISDMTEIFEGFDFDNKDEGRLDALRIAAMCLTIVNAIDQELVTA